MDVLGLLGAQKKGNSCASVAELQAQLGHLFSANVRPERADHISVTFELESHVVFHVRVADNENEGLEIVDAAASINPVLLGVEPTRQINASDAIMNQQDDPDIQRSVAKLLVAAIGEMDGSSWTVRQVSRLPQGWTFTYVCKDSLQVWARQVARNPAKMAIGEWSTKDGQDPVNMSRPAFDCRGSLTVAFQKSSGVIEIKYEHTPMHKTVAQLHDILIPPPAPLNKAPTFKLRKPAKPPKEAKAAKMPKPPGSLATKAKKRAAEDGGLHESVSQPKMKRKSAKAPEPAAPAADMLPEMPGALPVAEDAQRTPYNAMNEGAGDAAPLPDDGFLNLPPGEGDRRKDVANKMLLGAGIDPKSLSVEQFQILANQAPHLQRESLNMLIKYGAERLRIVHPTTAANVNAAATATALPSSAGTTLENSEFATPATAPAATPTKTPKSKRSLKKYGTAAALGHVDQALAAAGKKQKITRGACVSCKKTKAKCDHGRPSCGPCSATGASCYYPPVRPRKSRVSAAVAVDENSPPPADEVTLLDEDDEPDDLGSPGFHEPAATDEPTNSLPQSDLVSAQADSTPAGFTTANGVYQHVSGLTFPPTAMPAANTDGLDTAASTAYGPSSSNGYIYPAPAEEPVLYTEQTAASNSVDDTVTEETSPRSSRNASRRSLPNAPPIQPDARTPGIPNNAAVSLQTSSWAPANQPANQPVTTLSPSLAAAQPIKSRRPTPAQTSAAFAAPAVADVAAPATLSATAYHSQQSSYHASHQAATQVTRQESPRVQQTSPYQSAALVQCAKSRQDSRASNQTPIQDGSSMRQLQSPVSSQAGIHQSGSNAASYPTSMGNSSNPAASSYDLYSPYNNSATSRVEAASNRLVYEPSANKVAYQPYSSQKSTTDQNRYPNYGSSYNTTRTSVNTASAAQTTSQSLATSYSSPNAPTSPLWGSASNTNTQSRGAPTFNNQSSTANASHGLVTASAQQSPSLQGFSVRTQSTMPAARTTSNAYCQQSHSQPQMGGYGSYSSHASSTSGRQHSQQLSGDWYGFNPANNATPGFGSSGRSGGGTANYPGGGSHGSGSAYGHHGYGLDHDTALFEMLRNNHGS